MLLRVSHTKVSHIYLSLIGGDNFDNLMYPHYNYTFLLQSLQVINNLLTPCKYPIPYQLFGISPIFCLRCSRLNIELHYWTCSTSGWLCPFLVCWLNLVMCYLGSHLLRYPEAQVPTLQVCQLPLHISIHGSRKFFLGSRLLYFPNPTICYLLFF